MVGVIELESMTSTMSTWRSNQLSYTPYLLRHIRYVHFGICQVLCEVFKHIFWFSMHFFAKFRQFVQIFMKGSVSNKGKEK